jgi:hypothetical protein
MPQMQPDALVAAVNADVGQVWDGETRQARAASLRGCTTHHAAGRCLQKKMRNTQKGAQRTSMGDPHRLVDQHGVAMLMGCRAAL